MRVRQQSIGASACLIRTVALAPRRSATRKTSQHEPAASRRKPPAQQSTSPSEPMAYLVFTTTNSAETNARITHGSRAATTRAHGLGTNPPPEPGGTDELRWRFAREAMANSQHVRLLLSMQCGSAGMAVAGPPARQSRRVNRWRRRRPKIGLHRQSPDFCTYARRPWLLVPARVVQASSIVFGGCPAKARGGVRERVEG